jgi:tetratricopeptide (TPR) repeat protein
VRKAGNGLRITAQLVNVADGFQLWSEIYDRQLHDVFAIQDDIAKAIVNKLRPAGEPAPRPVTRYTQNPAVYNLYLQARFHLNKRTEAGLHRGVAFCEQALALEPAYAPAYAGLADGFALLGFQGFMPPQDTIPQAKAAAEKALAIDGSLAEAHTSLGCIRAVYDWNWDESAREFERALALNPNSAMAHYWYAVWYLLLTGQFDLCSTEIKKAQELDPLSMVLRAGIGWQFYFARQFEQAALALERALEMDEYYVFARDLLGQVYAQQGRYEQAIAELEHAVALSHGCALSVRALGHAYGLAGKRAEAQHVLEALLARGQRSYVSSYDIALVCAGMRDKDQALTWLEKAYEERNGWLGFLNVEPRLDSLRGEARFAALLSKVGLQQYLRLA